MNKNLEDIIKLLAEAFVEHYCNGQQVIPKAKIQCTSTKAKGEEQ